MKYIVKRSDDVFRSPAYEVVTCSSLEEAKQFILKDAVDSGYTKYDYYVVYGRGLRKMAKFSFGFNKWIAD